MSFTLAGLVLLSFAASLTLVLIAVALVGIGSSVFHPEASRIAHIASGGRLGFAQSLFQVGGNAGAARWALFWPPSSLSPAGNQPCCGFPCWRCSALPC